MKSLRFKNELCSKYLETLKIPLGNVKIFFASSQLLHLEIGGTMEVYVLRMMKWQNILLIKQLQCTRKLFCSQMGKVLSLQIILKHREDCFIGIFPTASYTLYFFSLLEKDHFYRVLHLLENLFKDFSVTLAMFKFMIYFLLLVISRIVFFLFTPFILLLITAPHHHVCSILHQELQKLKESTLEARCHHFKSIQYSLLNLKMSKMLCQDQQKLDKLSLSE